MSIKMKKLTILVQSALGVGIAVSLVGLPAYAQEKVERIEVTGSNIKRTEAETASPVQILDRKDIERSGKQSIQEVLRGISADNQGSIPTSFTNGFASGSAAVSLRGLGVNSTLILLNGRRMAPYGLADDGARTFTDLNVIPLEAVERVEVLKDGASAIYGSDAIGGVVNIILRKDYVGKAATAAVGTSYKMDGDMVRGSMIGGMGDLASDKYNAFLTVEGIHEDSIAQKTRRSYLGTNNLTQYGWYDNRRGGYFAGGGAIAPPAFTTPLYSGSNPYGSVRDPSSPDPQKRINLTACPEKNPVNGVCLFDTIGYNQIQPETDRFNIFSRGTFEVSPTTTAYLEGGYFYSRIKATGTPSGVNDGGVYNPADPANPLTPPHGVTLPAGHPDNPTGVPRALRLLTTDLGGRNIDIINGVTRLVAGLDSSAYSWDYKLGAAWIGSELDQTRTGFVRYQVLQKYLTSGQYRINRPDLVSQSIRDEISPALQVTARNSVSLIDFKATRDLMNLSGGPLGIAVGAEWREEQTNSPPVPLTDTSEIIGLGYSAFSSNRNVKAAYAEINAPVAKFLELNAAVRTDRYSDYGTSTTPKVGFKLTPIPQIALRGTYAEAFRAPGPTESGNSSSLGFTNIAIVSIGDPSVKPEKAKSFTLGLVIEPKQGMSATIDYFNIKRTDEIVQADQASILGTASQTGTPGSKIPGLQPNSFIYYDDAGDLAAVSGPYANAAKTQTSGFDLDLRNKFSIGEYGKLNAQVNFTHVTTFKRTLADGSVFEYSGTQGPYVLSSAAGTPKDKGILALTWEKGAWAVTGSLNYVGPMDAIDHKGETLVDNDDGTFRTSTGEGNYFNVNSSGTVCGVYYPNGTPYNGNCKIPSFTTFDLFTKWTASKDTDLTLSVQNVFNRLAPFNPYTYGGINYNPAFTQSGAVGTFFTVGMKYKF